MLHARHSLLFFSLSPRANAPSLFCYLLVLYSSVSIRLDRGLLVLLRIARARARWRRACLFVCDRRSRDASLVE